MIGGRYQKIREIGRGGMQDVYLAQDVILDREVALKTPQAGQATKRFSESAFFAARINHHNVAKTLDYFQEDEKFYIVEEFVEGVDLSKKMKDHFVLLDPYLGAKVLHHLAKGVAASHHAGVIHRDLKPSNIIVSNDFGFETLKITDFGIATLSEQVFDEAAKDGDITRSNSGTIKGAIPYMAPEMMFRKPGVQPGKPVDIWAVGAMMFYLLTGEFPFGLYLDAVANVAKRERKPWPPFMEKPQFSPLAQSLKTIVDVCLSYEPEKRPTADDLMLKCQELCYNSSPRFEGRVTRYIQNQASGFILSGSREVFFSRDSVYGPWKTGLPVGTRVCFASYPGSPRERAHPVIALR
ncbi:MAG: serine/threonine-protein kinase [Pseudomonadota bacterium]